MREQSTRGEPRWTSYFALHVTKETDVEPAESEIDESNIENYLQNENEKISNIIAQYLVELELTLARRWGCPKHVSSVKKETAQGY